MKHAVSGFSTIATGLGACLALSSPVLSADPSAADLEFFEKKVRPILIERCYECHSEERGKMRGSLALDTRESILMGGDTGPSLVAGDPDKSLIIEAVRYQNRDMQMPPKNPLPAAEVRILEEWVKRGAPDPRVASTKNSKPRGIDLEEGRKHWAFRPLTHPTPPAVGNGHPVDAFIISKLTEKKLTLSPPTDPATFIRRATFDLIGLPPTPEEIVAFEKACAQEAHQPGTPLPAKAVQVLIDRLLASPHYGEKWGRHWLDVARYADSNGLDENIALGTAWRYRDYVIKAFNQDKPFDRFLTEQIAGDLLPAATLDERREHATATAFLNLGAKVLAEPDKEKLKMDVIDEQIETTGRAFLSMTLGCVRCHDHKFDPISQEDYYALAAIFKSTRSFSAEKTGAISYWHETPLGDFDAFAAVLSAERAMDAKKKEIAAARKAAGPMPTPENQAKLNQLMDEMTALQKSLPDLPTTLAVRDADEVLPSLPIHIRGNHLTLGKPVERGFPQVMQASMAPKPNFPQTASGRLELARWLASPEHPLTSRVLVNRIWTWHFGQGIVTTPDNFGLLGQAPTHPELLDWLAVWFTKNGWSIKDLHRLIMTSATYQQRSAPSVEADPENQWLHHFPLRRLQAEEVRDALLSVAGELDLHMGGKTVPLRNKQFVFDHTSKDATKYDSTRRAIYLPIIRNNLYDLFQQFDYPDPAVSTGQRNSTIVAPQALLLMNSPLAGQAAKGFAARIEKLENSLQIRVQQACRTAYGRPATEADLRQAEDFLVAADAMLASSVEDPEARRRQAWELLCQSYLMTNEFIYLR